MQLVEMHEDIHAQLILIEDRREKRGTQLRANHGRADLFVNLEGPVQIFARVFPFPRVIFDAREIVKRSAFLQTVAEGGELFQGLVQRFRRFFLFAKRQVNRSNIHERYRQTAFVVNFTAQPKARSETARAAFKSPLLR